MGDQWPTVRIAAVQAAPAFLDREASLAKAVDLIGKAAAGRAELVVFPEGFIPAHPVWYHFHAATSRASLQMARELVDNAVEIPSPATDALCRAARLHRVYAVVGLCERDPVDPGLLYNTQLFLGPEGEILGRHRKLMPAVGERLVHAPGFGDTLRVVPTRFGPIGGLICGEASNPLAVMSLASQGARVVAVSWPNHFSRNEHRVRDVIQVASRALGYRADCYVVRPPGSSARRCAGASPRRRRMRPSSASRAWAAAPSWRTPTATWWPAPWETARTSSRSRPTSGRSSRRRSSTTTPATTTVLRSSRSS
jgi:nitrilase